MSSILKRNKKEKEYITEEELEDIKKEIYELKEKNRQYLKKRDFKSILASANRLKCLEKKLKNCL